MSLLASTLPSNGGYVAAAYIVFFALVLIYVAIMARRLSGMERRLRELQQQRDADQTAGDPAAAELARANGHERERETV